MLKTHNDPFSFKIKKLKDKKLDEHLCLMYEEVGNRIIFILDNFYLNFESFYFEYVQGILFKLWPGVFISHMRKRK